MIKFIATLIIVWCQFLYLHLKLDQIKRRNNYFFGFFFKSHFSIYSQQIQIPDSTSSAGFFFWKQKKISSLIPKKGFHSSEEECLQFQFPSFSLPFPKRNWKVGITAVRRGRLFDQITFFQNLSVVLTNCFLVEKWHSFEWRPTWSFLLNDILLKIFLNFKRMLFDGKKVYLMN